MKISNEREIEQSEIVLRRRLLGERDILIEYLRMKTEINDWHAVSDAAVDLREVDAKLSMLNGK